MPSTLPLWTRENKLPVVKPLEDIGESAKPPDLDRLMLSTHPRLILESKLHQRLHQEDIAEWDKPLDRAPLMQNTPLHWTQACRSLFLVEKIRPSLVKGNKSPVPSFASNSAKGGEWFSV